MAVSQYKSADALAFVKHKRAMMEAVQESSLGFGELPTLISEIALGTQKQFQKYLSERSRLSLGSFGLHDQDVMAIAEALKVNATVTDVYLYGNQISDQGAMAIAEALKVNATVNYVNLAGNQISYQLRSQFLYDRILL